MARQYLLLAIFLLCTSPLAAQTSGSISGRITFGSDARPLHQVSVKLVELKRTVVTDDDGRYEFKGLPPGRYTIFVHQEGFGDVTRTVALAAGAGATIDVVLTLTGVREQVTVTATGSEQSLFESIASVSTTDSTKLVERAAVGLGDSLDNEAGVAKRNFGPGNSRPVIRGFDGDRVLVASDGVRVGSLASQSGDHSEPVDVLSVDRVEVVKGPATLLYGSNAIGGVVNAVSGHDEGAHPGLRGYFTSIGSSNSDQASVSGGVEYGWKNWMVWGNATGQRSSDYKAGGGYGRVFNSFTRNAAGNGGFGYYAKKAFANFNFSHYQNRFGIPVGDGADEERSLRMWRQSYRINVGLTDLNSFISSIKVTLDHTNYRHQEIADSVVGTTFRNRVYSYRAVLDQSAYKRLSGRFGVEGYYRNYSTVGEETLIDRPIKQRSFSAFGLEELKFDRVTLQFGGRVENNIYRPVSNAYRERDFTGFSGAAGARFRLWKGGAFVANYTHSYRAPALEELYNFGPHDGTLSFEIGNENLRAEKSNGIDLSLRQQNKRVRLEGNFFYYRINDFVFLAPTGEFDGGGGGGGKRQFGDGGGSGLPITEYRQGDSRFYGTEFNIVASVSKYVDLTSSIDYVNARLSDGRPLPRIPPFRARFGVDAHYKTFSVRPEYVVAGKQDRVFDLETPTRGYGTFNLAANYVIPQDHFAHIFFVNAFNLGNTLYYNHVSFIKDISPEIGRGVKFGYTVRFF